MSFNMEKRVNKWLEFINNKLMYDILLITSKNCENNLFNLCSLYRPISVILKCYLAIQPRTRICCLLNRMWLAFVSIQFVIGPLANIQPTNRPIISPFIKWNLTRLFTSRIIKVTETIYYKYINIMSLTSPYGVLR